MVFVNETYDDVVIKYQFHEKKIQKIVRACSMFCPYEGYRSVTHLGAARVNRTKNIEKRQL